MPDASTHIAFSVKSLERSFGMRKALRAMSFELERGASLVVFGPNGAGKTTLLRILALLDRPNAGTLEVFGIDGLEEPEKARGRIGFISHTPMLYLDLTAQENLEFYAKLYGVENPTKRANELLDRMELSHRRTDAVRGFSRGMVQRMALARALVHDPEILLLDEPYTGLDPHASSVIEELLAQKTGHMTTVTVSHDLKRGYDAATHVLVMARGKSVLWAPREELAFEELEAAYNEQLQGR